jgi:UDP-N-acetylmuramoylalanine--D-glutamate ligase
LRVVVWGTGETGIAAAKEMIKAGHEVRLVDEGSKWPQADIPIKLICEDDIKWADMVIPSPGVPKGHQLLKKAKKICAEIEIASQRLTGKLIAVTGTNGKTTTVTLIHRILKSAGLNVEKGGNISPPLVSLVEKNPDIVVAEISSFQLEWIEKFKPYISVCMNITPDHLDRYATMDDYVFEKLKIFKNQDENDFAIINDDDPYLKDVGTKAKVAGFSQKKGKRAIGAYLDGERICFYGNIEGKGPSVKHALNFGAGVIEDMMVSALVSRIIGVDVTAMEDVFEKFGGIHDRMEFVAEINGIRFINDSKGTNVGAIEKALSGMTSPVILILGGKDKGGDFGLTISPFISKIRKSVLIGEASERIAKDISGKVKVERARDMAHAVEIAFKSAKPGDTVLLSPGCSSFDMFDSYVHRGEVFKQCVKGLMKNKN